MSKNIYLLLTLAFSKILLPSGGCKKDKVQAKKPDVTICKGEREALLEKLRTQRAIARFGLGRDLQVVKEERGSGDSASGFEIPKDHRLLGRRTIVFLKEKKDKE